MTNKNNTTTKISRPAFLAFVLENFGDQMPEEYRAVGETWHGKLTTKPAKGEPTKTQRDGCAWRHFRRGYHQKGDGVLNRLVST